MIKRKTTIRFNVIFGPIWISSPYLWCPGNGCNPLVDRIGITHNGRSLTVSRALSDFGSEESYQRAAVRFKEHYKYELCPSAVLRQTNRVARCAQDYVRDKLAQADRGFADQPGVQAVVIELDGCQLRTAKLETQSDGEKRKHITWHEVRMGLAKELGCASKLYVGGMDSYPAIVGQLFSASVLSGMGPGSEVIAVADGGNGLRAELENQFSRMQFILDKTHLKDHLYDTAEQLAIAAKDRSQWVHSYLDRISDGQVDAVIDEFEKSHAVNGNERLARLIGYLRRFADAVDYNNFKAKGYPIGSGEVESAHKSIPQKRMKITGACWHLRSINPMIALRVLKANGWWDEFWDEQVLLKKAA